MKGITRCEFRMAKAAETVKKSAAMMAKKPTAVKKKPAVKTCSRRKKSASSKKGTPMRYKCRICGYVYSPLRGEPHNGIPGGTSFEDLPETYLCPVCGFQGKARLANGALKSGDRHAISVPCAIMSTMKNGDNRIAGFQAGDKI